MKRDINVRIVEIGSGGGANFEYYPLNSVVTCVEPVIEFNESMMQNIYR